VGGSDKQNINEPLSDLIDDRCTCWF